MKDNTNKEHTINQLSDIIATASFDTSKDLKHAVLIVSVVANLFVLTSWIALLVTTQYDYQLISFLVSR